MTAPRGQCIGCIAFEGGGGATVETPPESRRGKCALRPELFVPVRRTGAGGKIAHTLIGNTAESHGVPDRAATHAALCELARRAFG